MTSESIFLTILVSISAPSQPLKLDVLHEIDARYEAEVIDAETRHLYRVAAVKKPSRLPPDLRQQLRDALPDLRLLVNCGGGSFKSQMKKADKSGADYALIIGESELAQDCVALKNLREKAEQRNIATSELVAHIEQLITTETGG